MQLCKRLHSTQYFLEGNFLNNETCLSNSLLSRPFCFFSNNTKKAKHLLYFLTYSPLGVTIKPKNSLESVPYFCLFLQNPNKNKTDRLSVP